ncbi:MAG: class I SAM-dependent methyltransferase [Pseudomonadota bacterium]
MSNGWDESAEAWIDSLGARGDWSREYILDPAMQSRLQGQRFKRALDVGCGEGRFCRFLAGKGIAAVGIDASRTLITEANRRNPDGKYQLGKAEELPFENASFDLVISYMSLCDIDGYRDAIAEMARVLEPGGTLLLANISSINSAGTEWVRDEKGQLSHWPVDRYSEEFSLVSEWKGIRITNWHRPLSAYMKAFLAAGLQLTHFDEPLPIGGDAARQERYRRAPWFVIMEWRTAI